MKDRKETAEKRAEQPTHIQVRGARVHNLKSIDVEIPLEKVTAIAGVSASVSCSFEKNSPGCIVTQTDSCCLLLCFHFGNACLSRLPDMTPFAPMLDFS